MSQESRWRTILSVCIRGRAEEEEQQRGSEMLRDAEEVVAEKFGIPIDRYRMIGTRLGSIFEGTSIYDTPELIAQEIKDGNYTPIEAAAFGFLIGTIAGRAIYEKWVNRNDGA
jgi:hypothetical protein